MEEKVGEIWHKIITTVSSKNYPEAQVRLLDFQKTISIFFRTLKQDPAFIIKQSSASEYAQNRGFLKKIANSVEKYEFAWVDEDSLYLPEVIDYFPDEKLNKDLYLWLCAISSIERQSSNWIIDNQLRSRKILQSFGGLQNVYKRLLKAHLEQRNNYTKLKKSEIETETLIIKALKNPGCVTHIKKSKYPPRAVILWLHPYPPQIENSSGNFGKDNNQKSSDTQDATDIGKKNAKRIETPEENRGLITIRMENLFTWGEFINVDRSNDDEKDENAKDVAKDLNELAIARNQKASKMQIKFDMDLPSEMMDDEVLTDGILLPEWDFKQQKLIENKCRVVNMVAKSNENTQLPKHLKSIAKKIRNQFQSIATKRSWHYQQIDGEEIDLDAYLRYKIDTTIGSSSADNLYKRLNNANRDLSCLLLADLSLSTDSWVSDSARVIDVVQDSLYLFAEALSSTRDSFSMYGFSTRKTNPIRIHSLKTFDEKYSGKIRSRISSIKPGYYTRMGAAIRHSTNILKDRVAKEQLLIILTDGKPNDLDMYEGRYGIEDTKQAIMEAKKLGLKVFCVTIDEKAGEYLPYLFGRNNYIHVKKVLDLPKTLPKLYARLTQNY